MQKKLAIIEFSILTISQKHNELLGIIDEEKSERLSSAIMELMKVLDEIENEYINQPDNGRDLLQGSVLSISQDQEVNS